MIYVSSMSCVRKVQSFIIQLLKAQSKNKFSFAHSRRYSLCSLKLHTKSTTQTLRVALCKYFIAIVRDFSNCCTMHYSTRFLLCLLSKQYSFTEKPATINIYTFLTFCMVVKISFQNQCNKRTIILFATRV